MLGWIVRVPFFVLLMGMGALLMLVPAFHAYAVSDYTSARTFLYGTVLFGMLTLLIGIATRGYDPASVARSHLTTLLAGFTLLPVMFAIPVGEIMGWISFTDAWFEMVSAFTTTGATIFDYPRVVPPSLHLWRALVGWTGGFLAWVMAIAILAPLSLCGFELRSALSQRDSPTRFVQITRVADPSERLARFAWALAPIYGGLTLALWLGLTAAGDTPFVALCHAMSTLATSGISPIGGTANAQSGLMGELMIFAFLAFAISRLTFSRPLDGSARMPLLQDPEIRLALVLVVVVPLALYLRHWIGAVDIDRDVSVTDSARTLWAGLFTVLSFLSTTGFEASGWSTVAIWSGLSTPGLILMGLAIVGGGVATTAGGVKLLRVYALMRHGEREIARLVHPHSVGGAGAEARQIRRQGAYIAWIFFMLFAMSIALVMVLLSLTGVQFETAMSLAVAALSNTGPIASVAAETPISYAGVPDSAKLVLAAAMVLGRLEALAIIALLNPEIWRR